MEYRFELIFVHVFAAIVWVGGMISMRFAAHYAFMDIEDPKQKLPIISHALHRLFFIVSPFVLLLVATGTILSIGYEIKQTHFSYLVHIKEGIWTAMFLNLAAMIVLRAKADKAIKSGEYEKAASLLGMIGKAMVPINIGLGMAAVIVGVLLRINL